MGGFFRFIAFLLLVGLVAAVGINVYNAGVSAGIASDVGHAIASGAPVPAGYYYPGPYVGHPWGYGFGFGGFLIGIFFLFIFFGLLRAAFGWGRWGGHRSGGNWGDHRDPSRHPLHDRFEAWHQEQHDTTPEGSPSAKT